MTTTVEIYEKPEGIVMFKNICLDIAKNKFSLTLGFKAKGKRSFTFEQVEGKFGAEFKEYFTKMIPEMVRVGENEFKPTGNYHTPFEKYLIKRGIEFKPGILTEMEFVADNASESYADCPFKLVKYFGWNSLTLVNSGTKKKVMVKDPMTGAVSEKYFTRTFEYDGKVRKEYFAPKYYRRLLIQTKAEVEVYEPQPETQTA